MKRSFLHLKFLKNEITAHHIVSASSSDHKDFYDLSLESAKYLNTIFNMVVWQHITYSDSILYLLKTITLDWIFRLKISLHLRIFPSTSLAHNRVNRITPVINKNHLLQRNLHLLPILISNTIKSHVKHAPMCNTQPQS